MAEHEQLESTLWKAIHESEACRKCLPFSTKLEVLGSERG